MAKRRETSVKNIAFVDGQNVYMATKYADTPWQIDLARFRTYLREKYNVEHAYYFLGYVKEGYQDLYDEIQKAGFILQFREHDSEMLGKKKGNVDTDIVFTVMKKLYRGEDFDRVILISGDGDYKKLVDLLVEEGKIEKILFPDSKKASSLYKDLTHRYFDSLDKPDLKKKIEKKEGRK